MSFHQGSPHTASPGLSNEMSLSVTIRCHGSYLRGLEQGSRSGGPGTRHSSQSTQGRWWAFLCLHRRRRTEPMLLTPWTCREEGLGGGLSTAVALPAAGNACKADSLAASALTQCRCSETVGKLAMIHLTKGAYKHQSYYAIIHVKRRGTWKVWSKRDTFSIPYPEFCMIWIFINLHMYAFSIKYFFNAHPLESSILTARISSKEITNSERYKKLFLQALYEMVKTRKP